MPTKVRHVPTKTYEDMGIEDSPFKVEVDDKYTGRNGTCLKARFWYHATTPEGLDLGYKPGKNGVYVPIEFAEEFIQALVDAYNAAMGTNLVLTNSDQP